MKKLAGNIALMLTPFKIDGQIDFNAYNAYVEWQCQFKPTALFTVCGSSEMKWLNFRERKELIKNTIKYSNGIPVIATANLNRVYQNHTNEIREICDLGVEAAVIVPPQKIELNSNIHYEYLSNLNNISDVPLILYEWPQVKKHFIDPNFYAKLVRDNIVIGIKDTTCNLKDIIKKLNASTDSLIYQANTPFMLDSINKGIKNVMVIVSTVESSIISKILKNYDTNPEMCKSLHLSLIFLDSLLRSGYPSSAKYVLKKKGMNFNEFTRWPNTLNSEIKKSLDLFYINL